VGNLDDLLKLKNGAVIVETVCHDLGIIDNTTMIEMANAVWSEVASAEIARIKAKEALRKGFDDVPAKASGKDPAPKQEPSPDAAVALRLAELFAQQRRDHEEALAVFGDAIEYLTVELNKPKPSIWQQIKDKVKAKFGTKSRS
jgi:hypothetical protein